MMMTRASQLREFLKALRDSGITQIPRPEKKPADDLFKQVEDCHACRLAKTVTNKVFGQGPIPCPTMLVGEAPGGEEDKTGLPFVGRSGQLLDRILAAVDMTRKDVYLANVVKCRPPNNRNPLPDEVEECAPFLQEQIDMAGPKFVVAMGVVAARTLLGMQGSLAGMRGKFYIVKGRYYMVTYHPAALLMNKRYKKPAWEDWKRFRAALNRYMADGTLPDAVETNTLS